MGVQSTPNLLRHSRSNGWMYSVYFYTVWKCCFSPTWPWC